MLCLVMPPYIGCRGLTPCWRACGGHSSPGAALSPSVEGTDVSHRSWPPLLDSELRYLFRAFVPPATVEHPQAMTLARPIDVTVCVPCVFRVERTETAWNLMIAGSKNLRAVLRKTGERRAYSLIHRELGKRDKSRWRQFDLTDSLSGERLLWPRP